ncbi:hypothetical protein [[Mycoplasma] mobile]|uniref:Expressed protein n=1 Tax=Mycoplasma mobile (strain ATCC 43663 / 163K / NCTC 11711) TaxID=267748 RepID=Q6KH58_MYCM1|nr:hypothetical protein [[Mycoplasma] mobile]AAT28073.1 expressed protein [Mycoplasma mobile 163K]
MQWFDILALIGSWIATPLIFLAYLPGSIKTIRTKQTSGIGLLAFSILTIALTCLSIFGWINVVVSRDITQAIAFAIFQTGSLIFAATMLGVKLINIFKAKKSGLSEEIYCKNLSKTQELNIEEKTQYKKKKY